HTLSPPLGTQYSLHQRSPVNQLGSLLHTHFHGLHLRKQCVSRGGGRKLLSPIFLHISLRVPLRMPYMLPSAVPFGAPTRLPTNLPTGTHTKFPAQNSFLANCSAKPLTN